MNYHVRQVKISIDQIPAILFQSKFTRAGSKLNENSLRQGKVCNILVKGAECMTCVIDLPTHLKRVHHLYFPNPQYLNALNDPRVLERQVFYKVKSRYKYNPLSNFDPVQTNDGHDDVSGDVADTLHESRNSLYSVFDFPSKETGNSTSVEATTIFDNVTSPIIMRSLISFGSHLGTVSGGSRTKAFINMDQTNLKILLSSLGEQHLFCPDRLNKYMTHERKFGKSPSTLLSRILSLNRYIDYMKVYDKSFLPDYIQIDALFLMMRGLEVSLSKQKQTPKKKSCQKVEKVFHTLWKC